MLTAKVREEIASRFWAKVDRRGPRECWPWVASRLPGGYGQFAVAKAVGGKGRPLRSSRIAWELVRGAIPRGMWVLHECDNPPCCNPAHLFLGTRLDNIRDMWTKGRGKGSPPGERGWNAKLSNADVAAIKRALVAGERHWVIAARYGVSRVHVTRIAGGHTRVAC